MVKRADVVKSRENCVRIGGGPKPVVDPPLQAAHAVRECSQQPLRPKMAQVVNLYKLVKVVKQPTSFLIAAQNSSLVRSPEPSLSSTWSNIGQRIILRMVKVVETVNPKNSQKNGQK